MSERLLDCIICCSEDSSEMEKYMNHQLRYFLNLYKYGWGQLTHRESYKMKQSWAPRPPPFRDEVEMEPVKETDAY